MNPQLPAKTKRTPMACIHCRERKVKVRLPRVLGIVDLIESY
jgi:hypothetical protein